MKNLDERIYDLFLSKGYDLKNNRNDTTRALNDMIKDGLFSKDISQDTLKHHRRTIKDHINGKRKSVTFDWINIYCSFFGCSADYILGFIEEFTHDDEILKNHADNTLSSAAVRTLNRNQEYQIITNALLETNSIKYFVEYFDYRFGYDEKIKMLKKSINLEIDSDEQNNFKLFSNDDMKVFDDSIDSGWEKIKENTSAVLMDSLWKNEKLKKHFSVKTLP